MMIEETHPKHCIIRHIIIDRLLVAPYWVPFSVETSPNSAQCYAQRGMLVLTIFGIHLFFSPLSTGGIILLSCAYLDTYACFYEFYLYFKEARFPPYGPHT